MNASSKATGSASMSTNVSYELTRACVLPMDIDIALKNVEDLAWELAQFFVPGSSLMLFVLSLITHFFIRKAACMP